MSPLLPAIRITSGDFKQHVLRALTLHANEAHSPRAELGDLWFSKSPFGAPIMQRIYRRHRCCWLPILTMFASCHEAEASRLEPVFTMVAG